MSKFHVTQIATHLRGAYVDLWVNTLSDESNLSRILARYAIDLEISGDSSDEVMIEVTDGGKDRGIDAIAIDRESGIVTLVQSKWRSDGTGSVDLAGVLKFKSGVEALLHMGQGTTEMSVEMDHAVNEILARPGARLKMIVVTTAQNRLDSVCAQPIKDLLDAINGIGDDSIEPIASAKEYVQSDLFKTISNVPESNIELSVSLQGWAAVDGPLRAFYGRASVNQIAGWFHTHGVRLFKDNIRVSLPSSDINDGIHSTLLGDPEKFWYYNNGITILAARIESSLQGSLSHDSGNFLAKKASIINGAQTVSAIARALTTNKVGSSEKAQPPAENSAMVHVRLIEVPEDENRTARLITTYTNTQNFVSLQDFASLDDNQQRIKEELRTLGFDYVLRSGEISVDTKLTEITSRSAAVALACVIGTLGDATLAKREVSRLFDTDSSTYRSLFNSSTDGLLVSRAYRAYSAIEEALDEVQDESDGLLYGVALHAKNCICHALLANTTTKQLSNPDFDFEALLAELPARATRVVKELVANFPDNAYPGQLFKNRKRVEALLDSVNEPTR